MAAPATADALADLLNADRTWRIRELSDLSTAIKNADEAGRPVLMRALVAITYAHWEGYVKSAAQQYLEFVARRKFYFRQLDRQHVKNYFMPRLDSLSQSRHSFAMKCKIIEDILNSADTQFKRVHPDLIRTDNLNSQVMESICEVCGVDPQPYLDKAEYIDDKLLKRRNAIAHGEDILVPVEDLKSITDPAIELMRRFGNDIENALVLKKYLVPPAVAQGAP